MKKEQTIIKSLKAMSLGKLIELWNELDKKEMTVEVGKVRGWLMDALEAKNPEAFDNWIENCHINDRVESYFLV